MLITHHVCPLRPGWELWVLEGWGGGQGWGWGAKSTVMVAGGEPMHTQPKELPGSPQIGKLYGALAQAP